MLRGTAEAAGAATAGAAGCCWRPAGFSRCGSSWCCDGWGSWCCWTHGCAGTGDAAGSVTAGTVGAARGTIGESAAAAGAAGAASAATMGEAGTAAGGAAGAGAAGLLKTGRYRNWCSDRWRSEGCWRQGGGSWQLM